MLSFVNFHTTATLKRWHLWETDSRFACRSGIIRKEVHAAQAFVVEAAKAHLKAAQASLLLFLHEYFLPESHGQSLALTVLCDVGIHVTLAVGVTGRLVGRLVFFFIILEPRV